LEPLRIYVETKFQGLEKKFQDQDLDPIKTFLKTVLRSITSKSKLVIDLLLCTSDPSGAKVQIRTLTKRLETTTNSQLINVYRGLYRLTVTKPAFKLVERDINLVDDPRGLACRLFANGHPEQSYCNQE
ncbi:MAG: hypothetical protein ACRESZ_01555, partial [Methylococcales bacterium]